MARSEDEAARPDRTLRRVGAERRRLEDEEEADAEARPEDRDERDLPDDALREARERVED